MTQAFIIAAFALVLMAGWALLRSSKRRTTGTAPSSETNLLLDHSPVGALLLDPALRITWANDAFCGLFGLIHKELIGRELSEVIQQELKDLVEEPDAVQAGLMEAYGSVAKGSPFEFYVRARDGRGERWIEHTCQLIQEKPLSGGRVAYFLDITPRKSLAPGQQTREAHLRELDQILLTLARKSGSAKSDEPSVMRAVAELASPAWKRDRWELWSLSADRTRWTLDHLNYATPRQREESAPEISVPQTGPYLRKLEQVRVLVTSDVESDPDGPIFLGQGRILPDRRESLGCSHPSRRESGRRARHRPSHGTPLDIGRKWVRRFGRGPHVLHRGNRAGGEDHGRRAGPGAHGIPTCGVQQRGWLHPSR